MKKKTQHDATLAQHFINGYPREMFDGKSSGDLFRDGVDYPPETGAYLDLLARLHRDLAARADRVTELVCGLPVHWKGGEV